MSEKLNLKNSKNHNAMKSDNWIVSTKVARKQ